MPEEWFINFPLRFASLQDKILVDIKVSMGETAFTLPVSFLVESGSDCLNFSAQMSKGKEIYFLKHIVSFQLLLDIFNQVWFWFLIESAVGLQRLQSKRPGFKVPFWLSLLRFWERYSTIWNPNSYRLAKTFGFFSNICKNGEMIPSTSWSCYVCIKWTNVYKIHSRTSDE